ncbi:hypothetical protein HYPGJ_31424 [Hyphomicrobium sp. GJ21]|nr:hypothetical protein HYPGJ_31424 [Hyphomicrobium sp. GJ21]
MWQHYFEQFAQLPWLSQAAPWIDTLKSAWGALNSLLMVGGLFWISQRLKSERRKIGALVSEFAGELNDKIVVTAEIAKAARNSADAAAAAMHAHAPPQAIAAHALWQNLHSDWQRVRDRIDLAVTNIQHPLLRKKYAGLGRDSYHHIIQALKQDGHIAPHTAAALMAMNDRIQTLRGLPAHTSATDAADFQHWMAAADAGLPVHPADDSGGLVQRTSTAAE